MDRENPIAPKRRYKNGVVAAFEICAEKRASESGFEPGPDSSGKDHIVDRTAAIVDAAAARLKAGDFSTLETVCAGQVLMLDVIFNEYAKICSPSAWQYSPMVVALQAQRQCGAAMKTLMALKNPRVAHFSGRRTIENGKSAE